MNFAIRTLALFSSLLLATACGNYGFQASSSLSAAPVKTTCAKGNTDCMTDPTTGTITQPGDSGASGIVPVGTAATNGASGSVPAIGTDSPAGGSVPTAGPAPSSIPSTTSPQMPASSMVPTETLPRDLQKCVDNGTFVTRVEQSDPQNRSIIYQDAGTNYVSVVQVGKDNFSQVNQVGQNNYACVTQIGTGSTSNVNQQNGSDPSSGSSNTAVVNQNSSPSALSGLFGSSPGSPDGHACLCSLMMYCQTHTSSHFCQSLPQQ